MKKYLLFVLLISNVAFAWSASSRFQAIAKHPDVMLLEKSLNNEAFELVSITDSEQRFRCPCWYYTLTFKKLDGTPGEEA